MGRIAPKKRKKTGIYRPLINACYRMLLRNWISLRQCIKLVQAADRPEIMQAEDVPLPPQLSLRQRCMPLLLKIWHAPDRFDWMEPLPCFHRRGVIIFGTILLLSLLWPYSDGSQELLQAQRQNDTQPTDQQRNHWQRYQIQSGQTLAQLFRANNLPVIDVFAMAKVEGKNKPLSNLHIGQEVRIERGTNGVINALSITTIDNSEALFQRQPDSSYRRIR